MDQKKIGKFIAERRKAVNLTQMQLAEKLNITDRAVSKWENGLAMPDVSIILELCGILKISADELLNGELVTGANACKENEETVPKQKFSVRSFYFARSIPPMLGVLALIISTFTYGASGYCHEAYNKFGFDMSRKLIHFIIGGGEMYNMSGRVIDTLRLGSGISLFGAISFICLVFSTVLFLIYLWKKKEGVYLASSVLLLLSGAFIPFILKEGTQITGHGWGGFELYEVFGDPRLGAGTVIWCVLCIFGGALGIYQYFCGKRGNGVSR